MIYSVREPNGTYTYVEAPGTFPATGRNRQPRGRPINGMFPPSQIAVPLPAGGRVIGSGEQARGIIAVRSGALAGLPEPIVKWGVRTIVGAAVSWLIWG